MKEKEEEPEEEEGKGYWERLRGAHRRGVERLRRWHSSAPWTSEEHVGRAGGLGAIITLLVALGFAFLQLLGILALPIVFLLIIFIGLAVFGAFLLYKKKGSIAIAFIFFVIILGMGFSVSYMQTTPLGKQLSGKLGIGGVQTLSGLRQLVGPLNIMTQILTGTYNPENLWRSDNVQSEYEAARDVGVVLIDVKPLRDVFSTGQELSIQGRLNAVGFPGKEVTAVLRACTVDITLSCIDDRWECKPDRLKVREARNKVFSCSHPPLGKEQVPYTVKLSVEAQDTTLVAGKQFVYASSDALLSLEPNADPLEAFGVSKESLKSWQKGDDSVNVGIGVAGNPDVLEAGELEYFLGVNIENPVTHTGTAILHSVELFVPSARPDLNASGEDFACAPVKEKDINELKLPQGISLSKCTANLGNKKLEPGDRQTAFTKIKITENQLAGQEFGTFFVLARLNYNYVNEKIIPLTVKSLK